MEPGQYITPTLRLSRLLGRGGMGSVWVADHLALGTQVAVKFMAAAYTQHPSLVQRFQREAMAAAQIKSPHVAQVFDHGISASGEPYIVMELLEGEDLGRRVKRAGPLPLAELVPIVAQVAKALHRAHQLGIVHRDIKPDNVFLTYVDGELLVKILDFGIAKHTTESLPGMTSTGSMLGTPYYMSPEQLLSSKGVDLRSDLWSLGVVVYHALTGRVPFTGETMGAISVAVHTGVYAPITTLRGGLPGSVDAWMARALARDPATRFQSAREMVEALEQAARDPSAVPAGASASVAPPVGPMPTPVTPMTPSPAVSAPAHATSDARSLVGTAHTRGGATSKRIPVLAAVFTVLALLGGLALFMVKRQITAEPASASAIAATPTAPVEEPAVTASAEAPPPSAAPLPTASVTASASAAARVPSAPTAARPGGSPRSSATAKTPAPSGSKDTIGF